MFRHFLGALLVFVSLGANANLIISPELIGQAENGVFMSNGRYFVAGIDGVFEVKTATDSSPNCQFDTNAGLTLCTLLPPELDGRTCFYTGMTTDDIYLYAACTEFIPGDLGIFFPPVDAALVRILPGAGSYVADITIQPFPEVIWYNGMAVMADGSLLMTPSGNDVELPSIVKISFTNPQTLEFTLSDWIDPSLLYVFPNGLVIKNNYLYFVGGQNLNRVRILSNGSPGIPVIIYQAELDNIIDDIDFIGNWIAMAEWSFLGDNSITFVHQTGLYPNFKLDTGSVQLSSVSTDPGSLFGIGNIIGTSINQGGVYQFEVF